MRIWNQLSFQDSTSPSIQELIHFHDHAIVVLALIISFTSYILATLLYNKFTSLKIQEAHLLELVWTILPAVLLLWLAIPSLRLLYLIDEGAHPSLTVKTIGHQWYWSYEYSDFKDVEFDSYILPTREIGRGDYRLLDVDNRAVIPYLADVRVLTTAADVMHSWTVPSLGVKADAIPGRLNQLNIFADKRGIFYGQCSEICGANHSFIPICLEVVSPSRFMNWVLSISE